MDVGVRRDRARVHHAGRDEDRAAKSCGEIERVARARDLVGLLAGAEGDGCVEGVLAKGVDRDTLDPSAGQLDQPRDEVLGDRTWKRAAGEVGDEVESLVAASDTDTNLSRVRATSAAQAKASRSSTASAATSTAKKRSAGGRSATKLMSVTVRTATREDAHAIARVQVRSWQVAYRGLVPNALLDGLSVAQRRTIWHQLLANHDGTFTLVAERNGELVGFCSIATPSRDEDATEETCAVTAIYVAPSAWRAGIGRGLLSTALAEVRQNGWRQATLWVFAANAGARAFYDSFGFVPNGAETHHQPSGQIEIRLRAPL